MALHDLSRPMFQNALPHLDTKTLDQALDRVLDRSVNVVVFDAQDALSLGPVVAVAAGVDALDLGRIALGVRLAVREMALKALNSLTRAPTRV